MPIIKQIMALDPTATFRWRASRRRMTHDKFSVVGSRGDRVKQLQNALKQRGYPLAPRWYLRDCDPRCRDGFSTRRETAGHRNCGSATLAALEPRLLLQRRRAAARAPQFQPAPPSLQPDGDLAHSSSASWATIASGIFRATQQGGTPSGTVPATDILQQILRAFVGATPCNDYGRRELSNAATPQISLIANRQYARWTRPSPGKNGLAIVAYAVMAILQAVGVVGSGTPAGIIVNTIIMAFGGLGVLSKNRPRHSNTRRHCCQAAGLVLATAMPRVSNSVSLRTHAASGFELGYRPCSMAEERYMSTFVELPPTQYSTTAFSNFDPAATNFTHWQCASLDVGFTACLRDRKTADDRCRRQDLELYLRFPLH